MENNIDIKKVYDQLLEYGAKAHKSNYEISDEDNFMLDQIAMLALKLKYTI